MKSIGTVPLSKRVKYKISARPHAGLFFCLASAEGAGVLFCPVLIQPHTSVYSLFCAVNNYTANAAKHHTGLCRRFSCDLSRSTAHDTRPTKADIMPSAGRCTGQHSRTIIIRYIKGQRFAPCYGSMPNGAARQPGGGLDASHARRLVIWHRSAVRAPRVSPAPSTRRGSPAAGARRAARNHLRLAPYLFSGFRPIANRGQQ